MENIALGFEVVGVAIILAALSLTLDFGSIDAGVEAGAPKFMEWYSAYGLMVTLIWLYLLILRLLAVLSRNR
jgi:uncharacterized YccA/Bax inhibitor family protein